MFSSDRILALNIGAGKVLLAEYAVKSGRPPMLLNYGSASLGNDPEVEVGLAEALPGALRQVMRERGIRPAPLMIALSGQMVFPRFVRLPAVGEEKLRQMIQYEVEQNVPFPLDEIVWNDQFIGDASTGEQAAMIVAAKIEHVREVTDGVMAIGLEPELVDVAPMALYNCLKFNEPNLDGCTILLDVGSRVTNLIFIEDEKIYSRCIPVAGNAITQGLATGLGISFEEAEAKKRESAYVALGGTYVAEDPETERISKIVRNVVTRLHAEISRSINFYRSQQGGSAPTRLILTGGSAVLPHLDTFFREKLQVEVSFLNPFENISFGPRIDVPTLEREAFVLAESVGLALRRSLACPIEINLMPPEIVKRKSFKKRIPYFVLAIVGILASLGIWTMYQKKMAEIVVKQQEQIEVKLQKLKADKRQLDTADRGKRDLLEKAEADVALANERTAWIKRVEAVNKSLLPGMWLTDLTSMKEGDRVVGVKIKGSGWQDQMRVAQEKNGGLTAVEILCKRLREKAVFGKGPKDVVIEATRDEGGYKVEFTVNARLATASQPEEVAKRGAKRR